MTDTRERPQREADFHDHSFEHGDRHAVQRFYSITERSSRQYETLLSTIPSSASVLEYGCGQGSAAFHLSERGVHVTGVDISPIGVRQARETAQLRGLSTAQFTVMDAEHLDFGPRLFDYVCGSGILHHLDLPQAYSEVSRVLRDDGAAFFLEPLGHNPLINAYRRRTPDLRTPDEHPLVMRDLARADAHFGRVTLSFFHLCALGAIPLRRTRLFGPSLTALDAIDRAIFAAAPPLRRLAWIVVMECRQPRG
jgi:SAM-dependent methyltransferase